MSATKTPRTKKSVIAKDTALPSDIPLSASGASSFDRIDTIRMLRLPNEERPCIDPKDHPIVYTLVHHSRTFKTYVGATTDFKHRLRQHRAEIKGGAKCTSRLSDAHKWNLFCAVQGFKTWRDALSFEKSLKLRTRHAPSPRHPLLQSSCPAPLRRRFCALQQLLNTAKWCERDELQLVLTPAWFV